MRARIEYHPENSHVPWVIRVNGIWLAYGSLLKAILKFPIAAYNYWNLAR